VKYDFDILTKSTSAEVHKYKLASDAFMNKKCAVPVFMYKTNISCVCITNKIISMAVQ
jgi:hypothetical protein